MRISDWSSDVCSSDLGIDARRRPHDRGRAWQRRCRSRKSIDEKLTILAESEADPAAHRRRASLVPRLWCSLFRSVDAASAIRSRGLRSEEHTSELQSLMRISYAVFCLKKKTQRHRNTITKQNTHSLHRYTKQSLRLIQYDKP